MGSQERSRILREALELQREYKHQAELSVEVDQLRREFFETASRFGKSPSRLMQILGDVVSVSLRVSVPFKDEATEQVMTVPVVIQTKRNRYDESFLNPFSHSPDKAEVSLRVGNADEIILRRRSGTGLRRWGTGSDLEGPSGRYGRRNV